MRLRAKVLVAGACTTVAILILVCLVMHVIMLRSYADLESRQVREHVMRASAALDQQLARLAVSTEDWAAWDDTYAYVQDLNTDYEESNLVDEALASLEIDVLAFADASGGVVNLLERANGGAASGLDSALVHALWGDAASASRLREEPLGGILGVPDGLVLVTTHPILMSDLSGPSRGTLLMAQRLDDEHVALLSSVARLPIEVVPLENGRPPEDAPVEIDALLRGDGTSVDIVDGHTVAGSALMRDMWGQPVAVLRFDLPRDVYWQGVSTSIIFFVALVLGTILPIGAAILVLHTKISGPVEDLSAFVNGVRASGDLGARITPHGSVEVASLAGSMNGLLAALQDSEKGRRQGEERYRSLVENLRDVIYTLDLDGIVTYASPAITTLIGREPEEVVGRAFTDIVHPDDHEAAWQIVCSAASGANHHHECRFVTAQGSTRWVWVSLRPQAYEGRIIGMQGVCSDISERRELEQQLRQAQKMEAIGQLAEGIAHDFNNLLTIINGYAASSLQAMDPDDPLRDDITRIHHAGERGAALTRRLLILGHRRQGTPQLIALGETLTQTSDLLRRLMGNSVSVTLDLPGGEAYVQAELGHIEQILMNLAINARDAMPDGGALAIRMRAEPTPDRGANPAWTRGPAVVITVQDTGCGMTPEVLEHAFEPFFTTKEPGRGTGLGLATVYGIVRQNHGTVTLESAPGVGTTVTIRLPVEPAPVKAAPQTESRPSALKGSGERVLLVEDQLEVRQLAQRMLRRMGYQVEASGDPTEVLARYNPAEHPFDLVLSDVAMPEMSGPDMVSRLRERGNGFAVVYMSGYAEDCVLRRNVLRADEQFLQKPFTVEQLSTVIHAALKGAVSRARRPEAVA